jgi:hypothetical protein
MNPRPATPPLTPVRGVYVNAVTDFDANSPVEHANGPEKYARLVDIKTKYDPHHVFHRNANHPAG